MNKTITKEQAKAFADDLALLQKKHGIIIDPHQGAAKIKRLDEWDTTNVSLVAFGGTFDRHEEFFFEELPMITSKEPVVVKSEDFENMSAHDLISWKHKKMQQQWVAYKRKQREANR